MLDRPSSAILEQEGKKYIPGIGSKFEVFIIMKFLNYFYGSKYYFEPKVAIIFFLGISSGIPFLLLLSTLTVWLLETGFSKTSIGLMAWVTLPYTLKFLWSPFFDKYRLPILSDILGNKRAWLIFIQILLIIAIFGLANSDPAKDIPRVIFFAFIVGFFSSCQDILIEGYRIDSLTISKASFGAGASVVGYRVGMLIASAGALYLSTIFSWQWVYSFMAVFLVIGIIANLCSHEPEIFHNKSSTVEGNSDKTLVKFFILPLRTILARSDCLLIFIFILSFKASDTILNTMNMPFLIELGFSKIEIAHVAKTFGILAMIIGGIFGSFLLNKFSLSNVLILCLTLQIISILLFILQGVSKNDIRVLFMTMGVENFTSGMNQVILIYYLTLICKGSMSGILFAIMTSVSSFDRVLVSMVAGWFAEHLSWVGFFAVSGLCVVPAICILYRYTEHFAEVKSTRTNEVVDFLPRFLIQ